MFCSTPSEIKFALSTIGDVKLGTERAKMGFAKNKKNKIDTKNLFIFTLHLQELPIHLEVRLDFHFQQEILLPKFFHILQLL